MQAYLPSPSTGVLHLGPLPLRAYAFCIIAGVLVACWLGDRRWVARGGVKGTVWDIAGVAVPGGIIFARLYHVITSPALYREHPIEALYIWHGGLGIPGGIAGGVLVGVIACRRRGIHPPSFADAIAPGVVLAQAIGRFGNYFNQELFGRPTTLPWGLQISPDNPDAVPGAVAYHPTFLYESLWNVGVALIVLWADRRFKLGGGRVFALYLALYAVGRFWIEALRIDVAQQFFGIRLNDYVMGAVFLGAVTYLIVKRRSGRTEVVQPAPTSTETEPAQAADVPSAP